MCRVLFIKYANIVYDVNFNTRKLSSSSLYLKDHRKWLSYLQTFNDELLATSTSLRYDEICGIFAFLECKNGVDLHLEIFDKCTRSNSVYKCGQQEICLNS